MGKKIDSLMRLAGLGFNVPEFELLEARSDIPKQLFERWEKVSIRTDIRESNTKFLLPFFPNISPDEAVEKCEQLLEKNLIVIASKGINPEDSRVAGKFMIAPHIEGIEYYIGPGTIRQMEVDGVQRQWFETGPDFMRPYPVLGDWPMALNKYYGTLTTMISKVKTLLPDNVTVEFSIYPYRIGRRREHIIYWEMIT